MQNLTWRCHICGDERPDAAISVCTTTKQFAGATLKQNVRYCNDRPACAEAAQTHNLFKGTGE